MALKITTFNCRGLQDKFKRKKIFRFLHQRKDDIILLQETHSIDENLKMWKTEWGGQLLMNSGTSNSRGVAVLFRPGLNAQTSHIFSDPDGRYLTLNVAIDDLAFKLINIYAPNQDSPDFFLDLFFKIGDNDCTNLVVGGDLNIAVGPLDYKGSCSQHSNVKAKDIFCLLADDYNLNDVWRLLHPLQKAYTRHQHNPLALSRLDYLYVSNNILANVTNCSISSGLASDHSLVSMDLSLGTPKRGRGYWKLNCYLLQKDADFIKFIKTKIEEFKIDNAKSACNPHVLWDSFKCTIAGYCMEYSARKKKERTNAKLKLDQEITRFKQMLNNTSNEQKCKETIEKISSLEKQLEEIHDFETSGAIIRSRARWAEEGERSTKYFCSLEKRRAEKKNIYQLKANDGSPLTNPQDIMKELHNFYSQLYSRNYFKIRPFS